MSKRPDKRITIDKLKTHDFFKGLDWEKLAKKEIKPPIHLKGDDDNMSDNDANEEYLFMKQQESKFKDRDYTAENQL